MSKKNLSKNIMGMKFMQRQQEAQLRKRLEEEQKQQIDETHWVVEGFEEESFPTLDVMNESTFDLSVGRRSFGDFNPQVEKLEKEQYGEEGGFKTVKKGPKSRKAPDTYNKDQEADVSSTEMAEKFTSFKRSRDQFNDDSASPKVTTKKTPKIEKNNFYKRARGKKNR